jgi:hypothetical protein
MDEMPTSPWSDDARVLFGPFRAYADLALVEDESPLRTASSRALFFLFACAAFVSFVTAGRLVPFHLASTMAFWAFIPAAQIASFLLALRVAGPKEPRAPAISLYFAGHGAWMLFFLAISAMCLFAPDVRVAFTWLLSRGVIPGLLLATIAWSMVTTYACFRAGVGLTRRRAGVATALFYASFTAIIVGYYLAMNEIQPQLPWAP